MSRDGFLSPHFHEDEFSCPCCGLFKSNARLVLALEELRAHCGGQPITVLSGTRCRGWNGIIGGASRSQHLYGMAADIVVCRLHPVEVAAKAEMVTAFMHGGIGTYPNNGFIHVDVRNGVARWDG